jgi:hypothetical protein
MPTPKERLRAGVVLGTREAWMDRAVPVPKASADVAACLGSWTHLRASLPAHMGDGRNAAGSVGA